MEENQNPKESNLLCNFHLFFFYLFFSLPFDILCYLLQFVQKRQLTLMRTVCKRFREVIDSKHLKLVSILDKLQDINDEAISSLPSKLNELRIVPDGELDIKEVLRRSPKAIS